MISVSWTTIGTLLAIDWLLRAIVYRYYADSGRVLRILKLQPQRTHEQYYQPLDAWLAPLPFLWTWLDIVVAVLIAVMFDHVLAWIAVVFWVGGRYRALQEFGHNAVHFALCRSHAWQWWLSDMFYQFPAFKRDMHSRHVTHTLEHHRYPNHATKDPNRTRVHDAGMHYPLQQAQFYWRLLYPLSLTGLRANLITMFHNSRLNHSIQTILLRLLSLCTVTLLLYAVAGWHGLIYGWWLPLLTSYPLFSWISLLTEHRWFMTGQPQDRCAIEYLMGRPTDYVGISGWLVRIFICPTSDAYHLAHSLYPGVRWNYLPAIDHILKIEEPRYTAHASEGLLHSRAGVPSALSELLERLTTPVATEAQHDPHYAPEGVKCQHE